MKNNEKDNKNLQLLKQKLQKAIDSLDLFNDKKESYFLKMYSSDDDLQSFFSILCPKHDIKKIEKAINNKQYRQLKQIAKDSILKELLDTVSLHNAVQNKNTTYTIECDDNNSIGILNKQGNLICSISFDASNCIQRCVTNYGGATAYIYAQFPTIFLSDCSYLSADVCKEKGYCLQYNDQPIENVNNDEELQQLHSLANKYTLTDLYYYINALTYYINKANQPPSKDDILNAMHKANTAVQKQEIKDITEYEEQDKEEENKNKSQLSLHSNSNQKIGQQNYYNSTTKSINNNNNWKDWFKTTPPFSWCYSCCYDGNER